MKVVDLYLKVRYAVQIDGLSKRGAARRFGIDPKTVAKMMTHRNSIRWSASGNTSRNDRSRCGYSTTTTPLLTPHQKPGTASAPKQDESPRSARTPGLCGLNNRLAGMRLPRGILTARQKSADGIEGECLPYR